MIEQAWNYRSLVAKNSNNTKGGGSDPLFTNTRYYKVDWSKQVSNVGKNAAAVLALTSDYIIVGFDSVYIGTKTAADVYGSFFMEKPEAYVRASDYKIITEVESTLVYTDNFYDNQRSVAMMSGLGTYYTKEDLDAMLIPITEEEFYSKLNN